VKVKETKSIVRSEMCQECRDAPAAVFKEWGGVFCYRCDHIVREKLDQLRAMVNRSRARSRL